MGCAVHGEGTDKAAAERLLAKIRTFVAEQLTDDEAALFAALVAPAVAQAHRTDEASGPGSDVDWRPARCPRHWPQPSGTAESGSGGPSTGDQGG